MGIKKAATKGKGEASSSPGVVDVTVGAANVGRTPSVPEEAPRSRPRDLRSSGKRPLSAEEADCYEASARRRGSFRSSAADPEPIVISDDDEDMGPPPATAAEEHGWRPPADPNKFPPVIQPIAFIASGQTSAVPDSGSVRGLLQRMENALRQAAFIIYAGWGDSMSFFRHLMDSLREIEHVGGAQVAGRCDRKLFRWTTLAHHLEWLICYNPSDDVQRLMGEIRIKKLREREARAKRVVECETAIANLRQRRMRSELGVRPDSHRDSTEIHRATMQELHTLHTLYHEDREALEDLAEDRLREAAKARVRADWAESLESTMTELTSFTMLDCAD